MDETYLDFLEAPPRQTAFGQVGSPYVYNALDLKFGHTKKNGSKRFKMAQSIAQVDELVQEIEKVKNQNNGLQKQLKDFQATAQQVQELYNKEKQEHAGLKLRFDRIQQEFLKIDEDLTNKTLVNEQIKARLAEFEGRPVNFDNLAVKYVKVMNRLEGEDKRKYAHDKETIEKLREYCTSMKLKIPPPNSPKKKPKGSKAKTQESSVQCNLLEQSYTSRKDNDITCTNKPLMQDQSTQCLSTKRDQASQYISTMITRQTTTEKIIQKHVQTMFPEPQKVPPIDDILNVYSRWSNIRSVSPLLESPKPVSKATSEEALKTYSTSGTCTMLCNIRRKIDYLPPNNMSNIKQEILTPSVSPTPQTTNRVRASSLSENVASSQFTSSILNLFNFNTNSALGQLSSNAFNELWQIFGKMLLSLLQTSNAGIATANQNLAINQQQFLDWLLDLYMNTHPQTSAQTQMSETTLNDSTSPVCFNTSSTLPLDVVRPQAQKPTCTNRTTENTTTESLIAESAIDNTTNSEVYQRNASASLGPTCAANIALENLSQASSSICREVQQITSNEIEAQTFNEENPLKQSNKLTNRIKSKHKIFNQIQELIPDVRTNKKKLNALKRLLKNSGHRKKSFELRKTRNSNDLTQSAAIVLSNESTANDTTETAVDFLKTFFTQECNQPLTVNGSVSSEQRLITADDELSGEFNTYVHKAKKDFDFIKPSSSLSLPKLSTGRKRKSNISKNIESKCRLLFGDSDSELEEHEMDRDNSKQMRKSVIHCNKLQSSSTSWEQESSHENFYQYCHFTTTDASPEKCPLSLLSTPVIPNTSSKKFSIPEISPPIFNHLESTYFKDMETFDKVAGYICPKLKSNVLQSFIEQDLELSSDEDCDEVNEDTVTKTKYSVNITSASSTKTVAANELFNKSIVENVPENPILGDQSNLSSMPNFIETLENKEISLDNSFKHLSIVNNEQLPIYSSDIERDLELSSDNESSTRNSEGNDSQQLSMETLEETTEQTNNILIESEANRTFTITHTLSKKEDEPLQIEEDNTKISVHHSQESRVISAIENVIILEESNRNNETDSEENSFCWSVITITDSSVNEDTLNGKEIPENTKGNRTLSNIYLKPLDLRELRNGNSSNELTMDPYSCKENVKTNLRNVTREQLHIAKDNKVAKCSADSNGSVTNFKTHQLKECKVGEKRPVPILPSACNKEHHNLQEAMQNKNITLNNIENYIKATENPPLDKHPAFEDEDDFCDSLSVENDLIIDDEPNNQTTITSDTEELNSTILLEANVCHEDTQNSSDISTLLNSTLYSEALTESLKPIVDDLLREREGEEVKTLSPSENKAKRGRKRKSECLAEVQPCKRSLRLRAKQMILEESINLSKTPIELGKYTKPRMNVNKLKKLNLNYQPDTKSNKNVNTESDLKIPEYATNLQMGFFKERRNEEEVTTESSTSLAICGNKHEIDKKDKDECKMEIIETPYASKYEEVKIHQLKEHIIYDDCPQSPPPQEVSQQTESIIIIPQERPAQYMPQRNNQTLFDVLINSYKTENQERPKENTTTKEPILNQYAKELKSYCYSEMELDPDCTSTRLINKLLSISTNYSLLQKSIITIVLNAEKSNVPQKDLPSIIQEMPPRHLSKCLQRLFALLKNLVIRNKNFCQELLNKIDLVLFNTKQTEKFNPQANLNLTQLYLLASKVQESQQMRYHPARLFIAKSLYFYWKTSPLMIHEVLMWYPTVLPHREDKTYDRMDTLISVLQHILMNTKYDMNKPELYGKLLLSKLRFEYHFETYRPTKHEIINVLVENLKNSKFYNIFLAFSLFCKRLGAEETQQVILPQHLLPLAKEYYSLAAVTDEYDKRIAVLLEIISTIIKPFPTEMDTRMYFNEFAGFLNGFDRRLMFDTTPATLRL